MFFASKRRTASIRENLLIIIGLLNFLTYITMTVSLPTDHADTNLPRRRRLSLTSPAKNIGLKDIGNPSELAWQAWLLVDNRGKDNAESGFESANIQRRITPKSIFIAPQLPACAEGYETDAMNRCVKIIKLDEEAHMKFLLERLSILFPNVDDKTTNPPQSTGPLQLNIPLDVNIPDDELNNDNDNTKKNNDETIITVFEPKDREKNDNPYDLWDQESFDNRDDENTAADKDKFVPLLEFIDDNTNNTNIHTDYTIDNRQMYNRTDEKDIVDIKVNDKNNTEKTETTTMPPTLVLLLSPTNSPSTNITEELIAIQNMTVEEIIARIENSANETEVRKNINSSQMDLPMPVVKTALNFTENIESTTIMSDKLSSVTVETTENPADYDDEDDEGEQIEDFTESEDEILRHSEAGMTVTMPPKRLHQVLNEKSNDEEGSKISSEVSISDDFIRETTLLGLNIASTKIIDNITEAPNQSELSKIEIVTPITTDVTTTVIPEITSTDFKLDLMSTENVETTEDILTTEDIFTRQQTHLPSTIPTDKIISTTTKNVNPVVTIEESSRGGVINRQSSSPSKIVFPIHDEDTTDSDETDTMLASSTNAAETIATDTTVADRKRIAPEKFEKLQTEGVYDYDPVSRDYPSQSFRIDDNRPVIKTIDDQRRESNGNTGDNYFTETGNSYDSSRDFIRFPSYENRLNTRPDHVRFPSEEANSIHTVDFKERYQHRTYPQNRYHPRPPDWQVPLGWRMNRQQTLQRSRDNNDGKFNDRSASLLRFWTRMPLVKDPSLLYHPTYPTIPAGETHRASASSRSLASRRINYYKDVSPHDVTRAFARSSSIGG